MKFNSYKEIEDYAAAKDRLLVVYDTHVLDVTQFASHHPGGAHLITRMNSPDITKNMAGHFPLSLQLATSMSIGTMEKQITQYIDREKPILPQIWDIDHETYLKIVHLPHWVFQLSPKMFGIPIVEKFSFCNWYNIFYLPYLVMFYYYYTQVQYHWHPITAPQFIITFSLGLLLFSFVEYSLHRFIFHAEKHLFDFKLMRYTHFMLHGIHHMFPFDPYRLVLPPAFTGVVIATGYLTLHKVVYYDDYVKDLILWTAFLTGYVLYDSTHYFIHHLELSSEGEKDSFLKKGAKRFFTRIKKHHNQHHYSQEQAGYGVSTPLWDWILRTDFKQKRQ